MTFALNLMAHKELKPAELGHCFSSRRILEAERALERDFHVSGDLELDLEHCSLIQTSSVSKLHPGCSASGQKKIIRVF